MHKFEDKFAAVCQGIKKFFDTEDEALAYEAGVEPIDSEPADEPAEETTEEVEPVEELE